MKARKEGRHGTPPINGYVTEPVEIVRNRAWAVGQIARLDSRLGKDKGAKNERERLKSIMEKSK